MLSDPSFKYPAADVVPYPERTWPNKRVEKAPIWCSTDLRDGNQALAVPMDVERKCRYLALLLDIGFTEIEIGFPSACRDDYEFARFLATSQTRHGVCFQAITQARADLIARTMESLAGVQHATVNLYIGTAPLFREVVFQTDKNGLIRMAKEGARCIKDHAARHPETAWRYQFTPEMFVSTEPDFAIDICDAVLDVWGPDGQTPVILNLESTVEIATPNVYADQVERFASAIKPREAVIISAHPHNDRGTAIAAAELALLAGADRIEGCLFGNGERAGNADLMVLAANLYSQGLHPGIDLSRLSEYRETFESLVSLPVHPRHPYAGDLAFTTFAGTHQDGVRKGLRRRGGDLAAAPWAVPYLPMDPNDLGHSGAGLIRVNGQSGKAGAAFLVEKELGLVLPKDIQSDFYEHVQRRCETTGTEITPGEAVDLFQSHYAFTEGGKFDFDGDPKRGVFGSMESKKAFAVKIHDTRALVFGADTKVLIHVLRQMEEQAGMIFDPIAVDTIDSSSPAFGKTSVLVTTGQKDRRRYGIGIDRDPGIAAIKGLFAIANRVPVDAAAALAA